MGQIQSVCSLDDLRRLEVINLCDGRCLGRVCDLEFDLCMGCITAILLPKRISFFEWFQKDVKKVCRIPWCQIERIGDDTILVRVEP
jgi:YlmC/YmxH family sporulation protein